MIFIMKTMIELLIRLQELRLCCQRVANNGQLTEQEKYSVYLFKNLVRDCLPAEVLIDYDRLKETEPELLECPEVFAMAVLAATYRRLPPRKRQKLVNHFAAPPAVPAIRAASASKPGQMARLRDPSKLHRVRAAKTLRARPMAGVT